MRIAQLTNNITMESYDIIRVRVKRGYLDIMVKDEQERFFIESLAMVGEKTAVRELYKWSKRTRMFFQDLVAKNSNCKEIFKDIHLKGKKVGYNFNLLYGSRLITNEYVIFVSPIILERKKNVSVEYKITNINNVGSAYLGIVKSKNIELKMLTDITGPFLTLHVPYRRYIDIFTSDLGKGWTIVKVVEI